MAAPTSDQIARWRLMMNDPASNPAFSDAEITILWQGAASDNPDMGDASLLVESRIAAIEILMIDSAKRVTYKQNQSSENQSDIFKALRSLRDDLVAERNRLGLGSSGGAIIVSTRKYPPKRKELPRS